MKTKLPVRSWPLAFAVSSVICILAVLSALLFASPKVYGMFTTLQWALYGSGTFLTFLAYHVMPSSLDRLRIEGQEQAISDIATSTVFTAFVRSCGNDHMIMLAGMLVHAYGSLIAVLSHGAHALTAWLMIGSIWLVATVSCMSAYIVYTTARKARTTNKTSKRVT